jgi:hypothetical protein
MRNFLRLIEQDNSELALSRMISNDDDLRVNVTRHGSKVQIKLSPLMNIMSKQPVRPFIELDNVQDATKNCELPNIYPFLSTTNFDSCNIYEENDFLGTSQNEINNPLNTLI